MVMPPLPPELLAQLAQDPNAPLPPDPTMIDPALAPPPMQGSPPPPMEMPAGMAAPEEPSPEEPALDIPPLYEPPIDPALTEPLGASDNGIPALRLPPGYRRPERPDPLKVAEEARALWERHRHWRTMVYTTLKWISQDLTGMFPEDAEDRISGLQEEFVSPALSADFNLLVSKLATLQPAIKVEYTATEHRHHAQQVQDAARWMLREVNNRHADRGNRDFQLDAAFLLAAYGMIVTRQVLLPDDAAFPLDVQLIDPCQVYPVWGGRNGLRCVYRLYRDTIANVTAAYGDLAPEAIAKLTDRYGDDLTDESEVEVIEYWDTWWRCVLVDDVEILSVTAHEYGYVPFTVQYAGLGEPMFTTLPQDTGATEQDGEWVINQISKDDERVRKAVPAVYYHIRSHKLKEAVMGRLITGFKKEINPPVIRYRSNMAAEKALPPLDTGPGMQNEAMLGEERIEPFPSMNNGFVTQTILQNLFTDWQASTMPMAAYGQVDRSNVSGTAVSQLNDAGMDKLVPHIKGFEHFTRRMLLQCLMTIRNYGHLAAYQTVPPSPLIVPLKRPKQGQPPAFALTADVIDMVGPRLEVAFRAIDPRDWMQLFNAGALGVQQGFVTRQQIIELAHGNGDFDQHFAEWSEEDALFKAAQHPKFNELFNIPMQILAQMQEVRSDPGMFEFYRKMLDAWIETVTRPSAVDSQGIEAQGRMQIQQMAQPTSPPPTTAGTSLPDLGMGPGSQGAPVGRPGGM